MLQPHDSLLSVARQVRLLCLDVDGVLTDGAMYYDAHGEALKRFHTRDAAGLAILRKNGFQVAWLTAEASAIAAARAAKLQIVHLFLGCDDKLATADSLRKSLGLEWTQLAYMGDDWFDVPLLRQVGLSTCPSDAHPQVRDMVHFPSRFPGGNGAVREVCDLLIESQSSPTVPISSP